jgi:transcriptional regulator with XRE-family HTH domain
MAKYYRTGATYSLVELGELARQGRQNMGLSQGEAADLINQKYHAEVAQPHISAAERGDSKYTQLIFRMVALLTPYTVLEEKVFRIKKQDST